MKAKDKREIHRMFARIFYIRGGVAALNRLKSAVENWSKMSRRNSVMPVETVLMASDAAIDTIVEEEKEKLL